MKKILSLDLGITSVGYSVMGELENDRYSLFDYGVFMFDTPYDKDGNSKKSIHANHVSHSKLYELRKQRKINLSKLFEEFGFGKQDELLEQERMNVFINKWELRGKKAFEQKLTFQELFSIFYLLAKHRGYKSLDTDDLLEELCERFGIVTESKKDKKQDEKGRIKQALKTVEVLKLQYPHKTVARIIYEVEIKKSNPVFRNHDNYNYMIRREHINEEIRAIILAQKELGLFDTSIDVKSLISKLIETIDDQKNSSNDLSLLGECEFIKGQKVAHQYSLLSDIFKMYQAVSNITFNSKPIVKITKEQIKQVADDFFGKVKSGKNISEIKYKDIRKVLNLGDEFKIFNKDDSRVIKDKKHENSIIKFHFVNNLSKFDKNFIANILNHKDMYLILQEIFDVFKEEKQPEPIYNKLDAIFKTYSLCTDESSKRETMLELIKNKSGGSLRISYEAMVKIIPYLEDGLSLDEAKQKLGFNREEDYTRFAKGIKHLSIKQFEDDTQEINNHAVKYVVSAALRLIKHLHVIYGPFDEIRVESTRELSQNKEIKKKIEKANKDNEAKIKIILENSEYQKIAKDYNKSLEKYARKILMWEEQDRFDIYTGKQIGFSDIFSDNFDREHIVPQSLGGLSVKHNLVLADKNFNAQKSNQLPFNAIVDKQAYINRVEKLFSEQKISWKKRKNLLATSLEETYKDTFESKSLRATSYVEALIAQILKKYYPFVKQTKNSMEVRHVQGRATANIRRLLHVKPKVRNTNIHHAIDAILIGLTNRSWLQKLSTAFNQNLGLINKGAMENIKKALPLIEGVEPGELVAMIEERYNSYGEESVFYKDIFGKTKTVNFWVSKKPTTSSIHKDTIYGKRANGFFTSRVGIEKQFVELKTTITTSTDAFKKKFEKDILEKMYVYWTNPNDAICQVVQERAFEIEKLLSSFELLDLKNKEIESDAKQKLDELIHSPIFDNNNKQIRGVKFCQTNLKGLNIRGGLATKEKTFIGFGATLKDGKLSYERIDVVNHKKRKKENNNDFKAFKNDIVFFIKKDRACIGGKLVSFYDDRKEFLCQNSRFPSAVKLQPKVFQQGDSTKAIKIGKAIGIIKLKLDILGNIISYQAIGDVQSEIYSFLKELENGLEGSTSYKSM